MKIKIQDKEIELKYSFRSMLIYEKITDRSFSASGLYDIVMFFYATILGSAKGLILGFDDFLDIIDADPMLVTEFSEWITDVITQTNTLRNKHLTEKEQKEAEEAEKNV